MWLHIHAINFVCTDDISQSCPEHFGFVLWIMLSWSRSNNSATVYPKKYAHGFVVLCFVVVMQSFIINSHEVFIHIHQGCFAGTGAIVRLPQCQWSKPDGYGKISQCITTTKHSKAKTVCIFLGIYCTCVSPNATEPSNTTNYSYVTWDAETKVKSPVLMVLSEMNYLVSHGIPLQNSTNAESVYVSSCSNITCSVAFMFWPASKRYQRPEYLVMEMEIDTDVFVFTLLHHPSCS